MKRCPQCNTVYDDSLVYCTTDGTVLKQESFVLPTAATAEPDDEEITVVHRDPITVDIPNAASTAAPPPPTEKFNYQVPPTATARPPIAETVVVEKRRNTGKYVLFLLLGLLLGGGLVLAAILFSIYLMQGRQNNAANVNVTTQSSPANSKSKTTPAETPVTASAKHAARTDASDDEFNGRVISQNAYVRLAPSRGSAEVDVLPTGDRLNIDERENEDSPWFHVTCEHGTSGWMHGNTIEYK